MAEEKKISKREVLGFFILVSQNNSINKKITTTVNTSKGLRSDEPQLTSRFPKVHGQIPKFQREDNTIEWINLYSVDSAESFVDTYPLYSSLSVRQRYQPWNNQVLVFSETTCKEISYGSKSHLKSKLCARRSITIRKTPNSAIDVKDATFPETKAVP